MLSEVVFVFLSIAYPCFQAKNSLFSNIIKVFKTFSVISAKPNGKLLLTIQNIPFSLGKHCCNSLCLKNRLPTIEVYYSRFPRRSSIIRQRLPGI